MAEPGLADKVVQVHHALDTAEIAHAFGGALALAYYAEPRATVDIDINMFVDPNQFTIVMDVLAPFDITRTPPPSEVARDGQARVWWGRTPLDLFFAYDPVHEAMRERTRVVPFGDVEIPILAPEHLLVAKVVFDRPKDWLDIEQMLVAVPALDLQEAQRWLRHVLTDEDPRVERYRATVTRTLGR